MFYRALTAAAGFIYRLLPAWGTRAQVARQRRGEYRRDGLPVSPVWVHAVSVGEAAAASLLVRELRRRRPGQACVLACHTPGGRTMARRLAPAGVAVVAPPLDTTAFVGRMLREVRPRAVLVMELEIWPHLWRQAKAAGIPLVLCNGRMPARELAGYRRLAAFFREVLGSARLLCVQDGAAAAGFACLAPEAALRITGNLKFDLQIPAKATGRRESRLVVLGSVHRGEEKLLLQLAVDILAEFPEGGIVLAPRDIARGGALARRCNRQQLLHARRSRGAAEPPAGGILILDTIGELAAWYSRAAVAVIGGSFDRRVGGHNPLEAAIAGTPVVFGPGMEHFAMAARILIDAGGAVQVAAGSGLTAAVRGLLQDRGLARRMGNRARKACLRYQGAARATVNALLAVMRVRG